MIEEEDVNRNPIDTNGIVRFSKNWLVLLINDIARALALTLRLSELAKERDALTLQIERVR